MEPISASGLVFLGIKIAAAYGCIVGIASFNDWYNKALWKKKGGSRYASESAGQSERTRGF
jgi:hypothetical protein